jgi:hypothetical protein
MFDSLVLDVVIGLIFIYLLYSLLVTIIQEILATHFSFRAKILERAIFRMLEDGNKIKSSLVSTILLFKKLSSNDKADTPSSLFYKHPLIKYLSENKYKSKPSYISKKTFAKVMLDLLRGENVRPEDDLKPVIQKALDDEKTNWGNVEIDAQTLSYLKSIWVDAKGDIESFKTLLEDWFDETMDRATGWYKKHTQVVLFFVGMTMAVFFNVDTLKIIDKLEKDPKLREQMVQQAAAFIEAHPDLEMQLQQMKSDNTDKVQMVTDENQKQDSLLKLNANSEQEYKHLIAKRDSLIDFASKLVNEDIEKVKNVLGLGVGSFKWEGFGSFILSLIGWILTALALSLGAPFWFDLLNKMMKLRSSVTNAATPAKEPPKK